jgi:hypothetical protein
MTYSPSASGTGVDLRAGVGRTRLVQDATVREFNVATAQADSLLSWMGVIVDAGASAWLEGMRIAHFGGFLAAELRRGAAFRASLHSSHAPIWRSPPGTDPLRALRVRDLRQLDRGLTASDVRARVAIGREASMGATELEVGTTHYNDGNGRSFAAAGITVPLLSSRELRVALVPNGYAEEFSHSTAGFLTPAGYVRTGLAMRFESELGPTVIAGVVNPHFYRYAGRAGTGLDGGVRSSVVLGPVALDVAAEFMSEGTYRYVQLATGLRIRAR